MSKSLSLSCVESSVLSVDTVKCDPTTLEAGDILSRLTYYCVEGVSRKVSLRRVGALGSINVPKDVVEMECFGTRFTRSVTVPRTEVVDWFHRAGDAIFEVVFTKQNGEERTLVGHHVGVGGKDTLFGRTVVEELVVVDDKLTRQERQVDCRTIKSVTYGNLRAVVGPRRDGASLNEEKRSCVTCNQLKAGDILSRLAYYRVVKPKVDGEDKMVEVCNLKQSRWSISSSILGEECYGTRSVKTEYGSTTTAVERMMSCGDKVFQVEFTKADGSERKLIGFTTGKTSTLGRSFVNELIVGPDGKFKVQERQVDHRTVSSVTVGGTTFQVSKKGAGSKKRSRK